MIERDILFYLQSTASLVDKLGGISKIYAIQAPQDADGEPVLMPWLIVEPAGGPTREKINATTMQERQTLRISVDADSANFLSAREAIDIAHGLLENYRGTLVTARDATVSCSPIRGWAGYKANTYRWQFDAIVEFLEDYTEPTPYAP